MLTAHADRSWIPPTNDLLYQVPSRFPNVVLVDWANLASQCPGDCFYDDGIHINQNGQNYYSQLIFDALGDLILTTVGCAERNQVSSESRLGLRSTPMTSPTRVAVTGAAGQIGYSLLFRIASGSMLGPDTPVILQLLEITPALGALEGVRMELDDCAFPLLPRGRDRPTTPTSPSATPTSPCSSVRCRARPGWSAPTSCPPTAASSSRRARPCRAAPSRDVRVLVVGNPANTNALIAQANAKDLDPTCFTAMTRLDHNRAVSQLAQRLGVPVTEVKKLAIWGNHSTTQYPNLFHAEVGGRNADRGRRRPRVGREHVHPDRGQAGRGDHRRPRRVVGRLGRQRRRRPRPLMGARHGPGRLDVDGVTQRRQLRRARGPDLQLPGDVRRRSTTRSSRASRSTTSAGPASTPRPPS